jgi:hypothetical protein
MRVVRLLDHAGSIDGSAETRPTGAGIELVQGTKERLAGDNVHVDAGLVIVPIGIPERRLGPALLRHRKLLRAEGLAQLLPLRLLEFAHRSRFVGWNGPDCFAPPPLKRRKRDRQDQAQTDRHAPERNLATVIHVWNRAWGTGEPGFRIVSHTLQSRSRPQPYAQLSGSGVAGSVTEPAKALVEPDHAHTPGRSMRTPLSSFGNLTQGDPAR